MMSTQYELSLNVETNSSERVKRSRKRSRPSSSVEGGVSSRRLRVNVRNKVMIARYYYWTEIRRRRFDDVMLILSQQEFFVEERTISNALLDLSDYLDELYKQKKNAKEFKKEYPNWCWDTN